MRTFLFWLLAFIITAATAIYQRVTGPTYPVSGSIEFYQSNVEYKFLRSEDVGKDCLVEIQTENSTVTGKVFWRRFKYDKDWNEIVMWRDVNFLRAELPSQPSAGKLEYYVELSNGISQQTLPADQTIVVRYKGTVPLYVLIPHVIAMFGAMLLSTRTGLEYFRKEPRWKKLTLWTIGFLFVGGFVLGPLVQYLAFGAWWTGFPFGFDLTDNKTLLAMIMWLIAFYMMRKSANPKKWALIAAVALIVVYLIPHSVLGSELDYSKLEQAKTEIAVDSAGVD
ncbi:MAG: hypothetical protein A2V66_02720 [Ignavibacteria bacterium RBG_13_36_8]|nr:MAG: hypothetical protein A2V66_02720 [Ignavibacteria bacterium RBG_13_36_8]